MILNMTAHQQGKIFHFVAALIIANASLNPYNLIHFNPFSPNGGTVIKYRTTDKTT